jgi:hypothetical protein
MSDIGTKYLFQCKTNYLDKITPSNINRFEKAGYQKLVEIAEDYFQKGKLYDFVGFFQESQYNVNLWTAHLIIEYGNPDELIKKQAIAIIIRYSTTPLDKDLANEEKVWLINFNPELS